SHHRQPYPQTAPQAQRGPARRPRLDRQCVRCRLPAADPGPRHPVVRTAETGPNRRVAVRSLLALAVKSGFKGSSAALGLFLLPPVRVAQFALEDLADGAAWQLITKFHSGQPLALAQFVVGPASDGIG